MTPEEELMKALEEMGALPQNAVDQMRLYSIAQHEAAEELYRAAVADGANFATLDEEGDVFVNTKWLGMVVKTIAESLLFDEKNPSMNSQSIAEVLNQTIIASKKFVGKA